MKSYHLLFLLPLFLVLAGCHSPVDPEKITTINIIDRNGLSETINEKDRLSAFQKTDFLSPQPYQKVQRIYGRDKEGNSRSCITSYHPNGQIKQYLEATNNRALGYYREWYADGGLKIESYVIGGSADLNTQAEESWLFDGVNHAWDEDGNLIAEILYYKGNLQGESKYYHSNGKIWKIAPFDKNMPHGEEKVYLADGTLFQISRFEEGKKEGLSERYWSAGKKAFEEYYKNNLLLQACYLDKEGKVIAQIQEGKGFRALLGKDKVEELQEYCKGIREGITRILAEGTTPLCTYSVKGGEKEGEEITYFPGTTQPKLLMHWKEGILQGPVKTWYENGTLESIKEMSLNKKCGLVTAWYSDGSLMMVEEYDNDKIVKGEYFRRGENVPVSKIERGKGIATLFESDGKFGRKICYQEGRPIE